MTESDADLTDGSEEPRRRYSQFDAGDGIVVYDREDTARWIQSDRFVPLPDLR